MKGKAPKHLKFLRSWQQNAGEKLKTAKRETTRGKKGPGRYWSFKRFLQSHGALVSTLKVNHPRTTLPRKGQTRRESPASVCPGPAFCSVAINV